MIPSIARQPQKKSLSLIVKQIKYVKDVSSVDQLCSVQPVTNVHTACRSQTEPVLGNFGRPKGQV